MMTLHLRIGLLLVGLAARAGGCTVSADCLHGGTCADNACQCTARFEGATCATEVHADYWQARCHQDKAIKSYRVEDSVNKKHIFGFSCDNSVVDEPGRVSVWWQADSSVSLRDSPVHFTVVKTDGIDDYLVLCPNEGYFIQIEDQTGESTVNTDLRPGHCAAARIGGSYSGDFAFNAGTRLDQINLPGSFGYLSLVQYATVSVPSHLCVVPPPPPPPAEKCCRYLQQGIRFEYMCTKDLHMLGQEMVLHQNAEPLLINGSKVSLRFTTVMSEDVERCEVLEAWAVLYETRPEVIVTAAEHAVPHIEACADLPTVFECFPQSCKSNPCYHGGTCVEDEPCECQSEWKGDYCETSICDPNPCENGGTCNLGLCTCASGWGGITCEINPCVPNLCHPDGGTCNPDDGHCQCKGGYSGEHCEVNFCDSNPCSSHSTECLPSGICLCELHYDGAYCENGPCSGDRNPCKYGGVCSEADGAAECSCVKHPNVYMLTSVEYLNADPSLFLLIEPYWTATIKFREVNGDTSTVGMGMGAFVNNEKSHWASGSDNYARSIDGIFEDVTDGLTLALAGIGESIPNADDTYGKLQLSWSRQDGDGYTPEEKTCSPPFDFIFGGIMCGNNGKAPVSGYTKVTQNVLGIYTACVQGSGFQKISFTTGAMSNTDITSHAESHIIENKYLILCPKQFDQKISLGGFNSDQGFCVALRMAHDSAASLWASTSAGPLSGNGPFTIVQYSDSPWVNRCKGATTTQDSCQNGGVCKADTGPHPFGHRCECPATHTGDHCQTAK